MRDEWARRALYFVPATSMSKLIQAFIGHCVMGATVANDVAYFADVVSLLET